MSIHPRFCLLRFSGLFFSGLQCGTCPDNYNRSPIHSRIFDRDLGCYIHFFCSSCQAIICHSCASEVQQPSCRWCGNHDSGITTMYFSTQPQQEHDSVFLQRYLRADVNIREVFRIWQKCMGKTYLDFDIKTVYWKDRVISDGWRFFMDFDSFLTEQLPNQFGMFISMMMKNAFARLYYRQPELHPSCSRFLQMPQDNQAVYFQHRKLQRMHSPSLFLASALITKPYRNNLYTLQRYLLSKCAMILLRSFGICILVDEPDPRDDPNWERDICPSDY